MPTLQVKSPMKTYETSGFPIVTYTKGYTVTDCRPMQRARWDMLRNMPEIKLLQAKARQERTCSDITKKCEQAEAKANKITIKGEADKAKGSLKKSKHPIASKLKLSIKKKKDKLPASIKVLEDDMLTQLEGEPPQVQWIRCYDDDCDRQSTVECKRCRWRFCDYHLERHWYCCITPPDSDQANAFELPAVSASIKVLEDDMLTQPKEDKANSDIGKVQKALDILNKDIGLANSI